MADRTMENSKPVLLITGGAGYIGSKLIRRLANVPELAGYSIRIYDNLVRETYQALQDLDPKQRYEFVAGDILDRINLRRAMKGVTAVVHLAAIVRTPLSFDSNPIWLNQVNHWGSLGVLEEAVKAGVKQFLFAGSASVYGPGGPFQEDATCNPMSPYAISKLMAERELRTYADDRINLSVFRFGSVFGTAPAMRFDVVATRFVYLSGVGHTIPIYGSGDQIRPLVHVQDVADSIIFALLNPETVAGETFNLATSNPSVSELASLVQSLNPDVPIRYTDQDALADVSLSLDSSKLFDAGFTPSVKLKDGLQEMHSHWTSFAPGVSVLPPMD